ncbi:hypothetical protein V8D89_014854 [Ganoderma adspersum]
MTGANRHSMDHTDGSPTTPTADSPLTDDDHIPIAIVTAGPPFDKDTTDIVLQTSDRFQFHVWKCILAEASSVFEDMFALGQPLPYTGQQSEMDTPNPNGLVQVQSQSSPPHPSVPVVEVPEDCVTLGLLLRWIYPPPRYDRLIGKRGRKLKDLKPVLAAAHKYQMDGVVSEIADILIDDCSRLRPLRVYGIGARHGLPEVMQAAARATLSLTASNANAYVEEFEDISGGAHHRLREYRRQCVATLAGMTKELTWLVDGTWTFKRTSSGCTCVADATGTKFRFKDVDTQYVLSAWFTGHFQRIASLLEDRPCQEAIADEELPELALKEGSRCSLCREVVHYHMRLFATHLKREIDRRIAAISLKLA